MQRPDKTGCILIKMPQQDKQFWSTTKEDDEEYWSDTNQKILQMERKLQPNGITFSQVLEWKQYNRFVRDYENCGGYIP